MSENLRKRVRLSTASCPSCGGVGVLKKIVFGMPDKDFDHNRFISGGCCVTEDDPEIGCVQCDWAGKRKDLVSRSL